jgi:hypothetical protein
MSSMTNLDYIDHRPIWIIRSSFVTDFKMDDITISVEYNFQKCTVKLCLHYIFLLILGLEQRSPAKEKKDRFYEQFLFLLLLSKIQSKLFSELNNNVLVQKGFGPLNL